MKTIRIIVAALPLLALVFVVGFLAACEPHTSSSDPIPTPRPATDEQVEMVRYAVLTGTMNLESYHESLEVTGLLLTIPFESEPPGSPLQLAIDYEAPDTTYAKGVLRGRPIELLSVGPAEYIKDVDGTWVFDPWGRDNEFRYFFTAFGGPFGFQGANFVVYPFSKDFQLMDTQITEERDGAMVRRFDWSNPPVYAGSVWLDVDTHYLHELTFCGTKQESAEETPEAETGGTTGTSMPSPTNTGLETGCASITLSKHNQALYIPEAPPLRFQSTSGVCGTWDITPLKGFTSSKLGVMAVAAQSSSDVWAVSNRIEHWDGTRWSTSWADKREGKEWFEDEVALDTIYPVGPGDVWVKGTRDDRDLILHWDGEGWQEVPGPSSEQWAAMSGTIQSFGVPRPTGIKGTLEDMTFLSTTDAWAVGHYQNGTTFMKWFLHWDGREWKEVPAPGEGASNSPSALYAVATDDVWALGTTGIWHWDGKAWSELVDPIAPMIGSIPGYCGLWDVSATSSEMWAVGDIDPSRGYDAVIAHFVKSPCR